MEEKVCEWSTAFSFTRKHLWSIAFSNLERLGAYNLLFDILQKDKKQPVHQQQKNTHFLSNLAIRNMSLTRYMDCWVAEEHHMHWHTWQDYQRSSTHLPASTNLPASTTSFSIATIMKFALLFEFELPVVLCLTVASCVASSSLTWARLLFSRGGTYQLSRDYKCPLFSGWHLSIRDYKHQPKNKGQVGMVGGGEGGTWNLWSISATPRK